MTQDELIALIEDLRINHEYNEKEVFLQAADELERMQQGIETLHTMYEQACKQRDEVMAQQREMMLKLREANEIIFKSCVNLAHWKRTAMRYLKRNVPQAYQQAVDEFNEHPDGRGQA